jgi:hypothetical protein
MALCEESLALFQEVGDKWMIAAVLVTAGLIARKQADGARAAAHHREALALSREQGDKMGVARALDGLGGIAAAQGEPERAARLLGAAEALRERLGFSLWPFLRVDYDRDVTAARAALGDDAFVRLWAQGRHMAVEQAVADALGSAPAPD